MLRSSMTPADGSTPGGSRLEVPPIAAALGERFRTAGYQLYLVGGAVRELLTGHPFQRDFDFATDARPEVTLRVGAYGYFLPIPWETVFEGRWRQRNGKILVDGPGVGFGGFL